MSSTFDKTKLKALATELTKDIQIEKDLSNLDQITNVKDFNA